MATATVEREVPAARMRLWQAMTSSELAAWFWPASFETTVRVDVRLGGSFSIASDAAGLGVSGAYLDVVAPERLVQTWRWAGESATSTVTTTLLASGASTHLRIVHEGLQDEEDAERHRQGWSDCLDRLTPYLGAAS